MLDSIIQFSVKNKLIIGLLMVGLVAWGGYSLSRLPIDAVPDITNNQVQVITASPSLAAEEVERLITFPVEITMATIPKIEEIRSFSRFGLSVVTLVFEEQVDVYWARQQVSERLSEVKSQIPPEAGEPGMAPITTGLGEIYQYVVGTEPGYEEEYDARELRTIQDWIVRRQLLGTPGVADVSSFGGYLKQYEVAIDPDQLKAMDVSIGEVFRALQANNENTGGAYIEKNRQAYFIRSEGLVGSLEDIGQILVKNHADGIPVLVRDVAKVQLGSAVRYGATTRNGEGEVVSAIVLMLKGENSAEVIAAVKDRIEDIRKTLPEGVTIEPFLDRSKLVKNAIGTVTTNLTEGALIVIFVLLLLLGNLRAGLIVASVIPLALLFAFGMMRLFGVSGNLMSLGAIDFGLIVDGAVIIVEATLHHLGVRQLGRKLTQSEMDEEVYQSASKIRNSAAFGEIIILIVYLPILALVGTEGKMFRPMAQTVAFAILGAFLLSLTYVPMVSAAFLSKKPAKGPNISDRIMALLHRVYDPAIRWAMRRRGLVMVFTLTLFGAALWLFSTLGGEFIPTLEEGDFAVETRVMTGSSLENTIVATTQAEEILLDQFPEVTQVVSKIGAGEIPTDPMPMEAADLMIILKNKDEWVTAHDRESLAEAMADALEAIPGVTFGFQQPIQMRFNELMTGVRQDVAVKIYGDDLDALSGYAQQIGVLANGVAGAEDVYVEEVTGVPQVVIDYRRDQLAKFGLSIREVNHAVQTAFAGTSAGLVYDQERRFDLVVRLDDRLRHDVEAVRNLYISRQDGHQIPLHQVAEVAIQEGPYQIQRDNTRRRILVAFNVRNRDVASVVEELQAKISDAVELPPGYSITFGGQFENLVEARERLSYAVPLALLLIFVLLYFTFRSVKQGLLIFSAIPLSAIGGVAALWLRGMPFSISAGVGFIALFGVAVLNGIVLLAEFNHLKESGMADIRERIFEGVKVRLRPVIMTASVASLGFLPMALSTSSGAEVQKPLATVVIGGLITATFLTLVVLPVLYYYLEQGWKSAGRKGTAMVLVFLLGGVCVAQAQPSHEVITYRSLEQAIDTAIAKNPGLEAAQWQTAQREALVGASWNLPKTNLSLTHGQYNSINPKDNQINLSQSLAFSTVYLRQKRVAEAQAEASAMREAVTRNELVYQVKQAWYGLWLEKSKRQLLLQLDTAYRDFVRAATLRYETGETNLLEKATAETQVAQLQVMLAQNEADAWIYQRRLQTLLNQPQPVDFEAGTMVTKEHPADEVVLVEGNPALSWQVQQQDVAAQELALARSKWLPDITLGYFNQSLLGPGMDGEGNPVVFTPRDRFSGFSIGLSVPILGAAAQNAEVQASGVKQRQEEARLTAVRNALQGQMEELQQEHHKYATSLRFYEAQVLPQANLIATQAKLGFARGEIGYVEFLQGLNRVLTLRTEYLDILHQYNQTTISLEYLAGLR